jgi:hypothetical protein
MSGAKLILQVLSQIANVAARQPVDAADIGNFSKIGALAKTAWLPI